MRKMPQTRIIPKEKLVDGEYYYGWMCGYNAPRVCRWDESGPCFVTWDRILGHKELIDVTLYEFKPFEIVTWGVDEIPLKDQLNQFIEGIRTELSRELNDEEKDGIV